MNAAVDDLNPEKKRWRKRFVTLTASIMVPVAIAVGSWMAHFHTSRPVMASESIPPDFVKVPVQPTVRLSSTLVTHPTDKAVTRLLPEEKQTDPAVVTFLGVYQLEQYEAEFQQAIEKGTLDALSLRIYGETGYQLIQLSSVPDHIRKQYGALAFSLNRHQSPVWLLFWRPQLELRRFYSAYRGEEIYKLQERLRDLHFYHYNIDGIVGRRLMNAVISFQKESGLPITGFPDPVTLFWVCHQQEDVSNG